MSLTTVTFYFDYISPNAYIAWSQLPRLMEQYAIKVEPVPVLFTGLLRAFGTMGPAEQPAKQQWMSKNIARKAEALGLPLKAPRYHPFNPLLSLRLSTLPMTADERWKLIDCLMTGAWAEQQHLSEADAVIALLNAKGFDGEEWVKQASTPEAADALKLNTQRAVENNVFGIPTAQVGDELFFGYDDFTFLEMLLAGKDPLMSAQSQEWLSATWSASSMRKEVLSKTANKETHHGK